MLKHLKKIEGEKNTIVYLTKNEMIKKIEFEKKNLQIN